MPYFHTIRATLIDHHLTKLVPDMTPTTSNQSDATLRCFVVIVIAIVVLYIRVYIAYRPS